MKNAQLENQRADTTPKCANCANWTGVDHAIAPCQLHNMTTLDLAVCSQWEGK
jgi:hypothetical protein